MSMEPNFYGLASPSSFFTDDQLARHAAMPVELILERPGCAPQVVIVQGGREADRVFGAWTCLKARRGKPFGGAIQSRYDAQGKREYAAGQTDPRRS